MGGKRVTTNFPFAWVLSKFNVPATYHIKSQSKITFRGKKDYIDTHSTSVIYVNRTASHCLADVVEKHALAGSTALLARMQTAGWVSHNSYGIFCSEEHSRGWLGELKRSGVLEGLFTGGTVRSFRDDQEGMSSYIQDDSIHFYCNVPILRLKDYTYWMLPQQQYLTGILGALLLRGITPASVIMEAHKYASLCTHAPTSVATMLSTLRKNRVLWGSSIRLRLGTVWKIEK